MSEHKKLVIFLCNGNTIRSQMAEGLLNHMGGDRFTAVSAGVEPGERVHPMAIAVLAEEGMDISSHQPKGIGVYLGKEAVLHMITVCDKAQQSCPRVWPGLPEGNRHHWMLDNPSGAEGSEEEKLAAFRKVRDDLKAKIRDWLRKV
ncbi:arsenate reductase ArsC [Desulfobotulus sp. H1]|uniref:Arsenate reductase ArsC n=1 Tax=Desulfobotulus pelophilus TaxID=2823377 RepID=A0ABT3N7E5_9BACT|nr:arsenate reductase ArsC [Desulfobotulus pelophilus]MCW7753381.1 arsenate reductase ArsC [Desulfobotulus pelophilus]